MTATNDDAMRFNAATHALGAKHCPVINDARVWTLAKHLSVVDGVVLVTGGEVRSAGSRYVVVEGDGKPRYTDDLLGTGIPLAYPLTRLVDDLRLADRDFDW